MAPEINQLQRSNRKTIAILVDGEGKVIVRAPHRVPMELIWDFVKSKQEWIEERKRAAKARAKTPRHQFVEGEQFLVLGRQVPLLLVPATKGLRFDGGHFLLGTHQPGSETRLFEQIYKKIARAHFTERLGSLSAQFGYHVGQFRLSSARTRWGSCSTRGTISLTWRLVMAPPDVIDYVILHELAHLKFHDHSNNFWGEVKWMMPNYAEKRTWLKVHGQQLTLK